MNFSAFGGPFSGIHQFAAKFGSNDGAFTSTNSPGNGAAGTNGVGGLGASAGNNGVGGVATTGGNLGQQQDLNRYHGATNGNHFNQNTTSMVNTPMSYGQNMTHPYGGGANQQTTNDHTTFGNGNTSMGNDHQSKVTKGGNVLKVDRDDMINQQILQNVNQSWQTLTNPSNTVDYSSHLLSATLPISIQHLLKYSETIKKEPNSGSVAGSGLNSPGPLSGLIGVETNAFNVQKDLLSLKNGSNLNLALGNVAVSAAAASLGLNHQHLMQHHQQQQQQQHSASANHHTDNGFVNQQTSLANSMAANGGGQNVVSSDAHNSSSSTVNGGGGAANGDEAPTTGTGKTKTKKQKKRKPPKEKKPRPKPGQIRETKALDGSPLFCCPECQMAYPERGLIEQHVISHAVERRFVCDICNAALKRKDHLTRHKLSHIPDRPHICSICLKSFKRKEQLTLHIVIHTGEKKHICGECGKGFYRKDHLRKHTRSHIARRVKSEMSASNGAGSGSGSGTANGNATQNNSTLAGSLMATNMQGAPVTAS
ncbi:zinc finger and SCAN domain-containing protein 25 [Anopheles maculipalpis]|uniref:zinc finger and SCAN domain-containing protein 25 n=1 Tax=Anopheles maculipalpis TaxID=1496333 RepID=UPI002158FD6D|nr:zinc finger and SCAN domain-containing protein 25 [Anopheles maculipalpis]